MSDTSATPVASYAAQSATSPLAPHKIQRRAVGPKDVQIAIEFCGVCHTDLHQARNDWGRANYPIVPGHEIVGKVTALGAEVTHLRVGNGSRWAVLSTLAAPALLANRTWNNIA